MLKACVAVVAGLACAAAVPACAAPAGADDGDLWIINAAGRPISVIVDDAHLADLPRLANVRRALAAGGHGVAVVMDGRIASVWEDLDVHNVSLNARGRSAWCYLAVRGGDGGVRLDLLPPTACRQIIAAGPPEIQADLAPAHR